MPPTDPEPRAREVIDRLLGAAGWLVQDFRAADLQAARGVALREFELNAGHGTADYLLYVDGKACGVIEAKKQGATLTGVEAQSARYAQGLPAALPAWRRPRRYAMHQENELVPYPERVAANFKAWMAQQQTIREKAGKAFTDEQRWWLEKMAEHIASNLGIEADDFGYAPFDQRGGLGRVHQLFGVELPKVIDDLNRELVA